MNAGVEIILERIKTHPEEFVSKGGGRIANGKWSRVLDNYGGHLDEEDIDVINNAIDKIQQDYFTEEVMTILVDGVDKASLEEEISSMAHSITTKKILLTSPDYAQDRIVTIGSQSFKDLLDQGWVDPKRMRATP